jgi:hypothetical protein
VRRPSGVLLSFSSLPQTRTYPPPFDWLAGYRRTAWIVFVLDTVASLETGCPRLISALELADFPLPAPDTIWLAPDAVSWAQALSASLTSDKTLGTALNLLLLRPGQPEPACLAEAKWQSGSFAWLCLILCITREVVELGEGKRRSTTAFQDDYDDDDDDAREEGRGLRWAAWAKDDDMPAVLAGALERWRRGWDFDSLTSPVLPTACEDVYDEQPTPASIGGAAAAGCFDGNVPTPVESVAASPATAATGSSSSRPANPPYADVYFCREAVRPLPLLLRLPPPPLPGSIQD